MELREAGISCAVVTRPGRELPTARAVGGRQPRSRVGQHHRVVRSAVRAIREMRPQVVVIQNHVLPPLEVAVDRAARGTGSAVVRVVHDHVLHSRSSGSQMGLTRALQQADVVLAHSHFVARQLERTVHRDIGVLPLPLYRGMTADMQCLPDELAGIRPLALQFGIVKRAYKGTDVVLKLADDGVGRWRFSVIGAGAPDSRNVVSIDHYLESSQLAAAVAAADVSLFPYRAATQSGGVLLAQTLGSVPLATAVGGIPEQIRDGVTGRLLAPNASVDDWKTALLEIGEPGRRLELAAAAQAHVLASHETFRRTVIDLFRGLGA